MVSHFIQDIMVSYFIQDVTVGHFIQDITVSHIIQDITVSHYVFLLQGSGDILFFPLRLSVCLSQNCVRFIT